MTTQPKSDQVVFAGFITRAIAFIIDIVAILAIAILTRVAIQALLVFFNNIIPGAEIELGATLTSVLGVLTGGVLQLGYFMFCWAVIGQTPGMALMGLQVVRKDGRPPNLLHTFIRYIGLLISFLALGLGFLWVLINRQRRGWHDLMAGTYVVYAETARLYHMQLSAAKRRAQTTSEKILADSKQA